MQNGEELGALPGPPRGAAGSSAPETVSSSHGCEESASLVPSRPPLQSPFLTPPNGRRTTMFATSPPQNTPTAVPSWVPDARVSHTQNSEYLAALLDLSVTAGNAAVFSTIRTLHEMSSDEGWEYTETLHHAYNVSETLCPKAFLVEALGRGEEPWRYHQSPALLVAFQQGRLVLAHHSVLDSPLHHITAPATPSRLQE